MREGILRAVTSATAATILQLDRKAFDNLILRLGADALPPGRQGVERRIPVSLIEELLLARDLALGLGLPMREAFGVARQVLNRDAGDGSADWNAGFSGSLRVGSYCQLGADLSRLREELQARIEEAVESVVRRPRGRPRKSGTTPVPDLGDA